MAYLTKLKHTGSVISSSNQFGAKMFTVAAGFFQDYGRGVFVGTGSGVVAQYFIQASIPFVFIEKHPAFVRQFHERLARMSCCCPRIFSPYRWTTAAVVWRSA